MHMQLLEVSDWLNAHINESIWIDKREQEDLDQVRVQLEEIGFRESTQSLDGYTDGSAILLHGAGHVIKEEQEVPLPQNTFEIQVSGLVQAYVKNDKAYLETERANYSLRAE
ncbi:hypothetical protein [Paenibacillus sp. IHBB 10380]|uniref:hypothetical protein n=1 Tax=Paenibacillus sp. IHBB 10380 TaxID=1566358 RepID=UPI0006986764|nr:hypothetical protein [Paenibacillus sp. IHBB 10380]